MSAPKGNVVVWTLIEPDGGRERAVGQRNCPLLGQPGQVVDEHAMLRAPEFADGFCVQACPDLMDVLRLILVPEGEA